MEEDLKQLLLKDLCARLPYGVKVQDELGRINKLVIGNADLVRLYYNDFSIYSEKQISLPLLRPMSSMTDDEKDTCSLAENYYPHNVIDWLNANHFDYRGLIEKGLAIEAPDGIYNSKEH